MKITIEKTEDLTTLDGVPVRIWNGRTEGGVDCLVFVHRIAVAQEADSAEFDRELNATAVPIEALGVIPGAVDLMDVDGRTEAEDYDESDDYRDLDDVPDGYDGDGL